MSDDREREEALDALAGVPFIQLDEREERPDKWPVGVDRDFVLTPMQLQSALLMWAAVEHGLPSGQYRTRYGHHGPLHVTFRRNR